MLGMSSNRQRVRCPRCREIVSFDPAAAERDDPAPAKPEAIESSAQWTARLALVEARLEKLEEQVERFAARLPTPGGEHSSRHTDSSTPSLASSGANSRSSPPRPEYPRPAGLRRAEDEPRRVVVITSPNSPASLVKYLETILAAEYRAVDHGRDPRLSERCGPGLTLVAAPSIGSNHFAMTPRLLRAAGFTVNCQLDPNLSGAEIFVVAGSGAVLEKSAAELMRGRS